MNECCTDDVAITDKICYECILWLVIDLFRGTLLLIAYPLAMILKKTGMGKKGFVVFIFILPMWMNFLLRTYAWLNLLDDGGILFNIMASGYAISRQRIVQAIDKLSDSPSAFKCSGLAMALTFQA